jgi:hypothetical protein
LHELGVSWKTCHVKHPKQAAEAQEAIKKLQSKRAIYSPIYIPFDRLEMWFQDEAHLNNKIPPRDYRAKRF